MNTLFKTLQTAFRNWRMRHATIQELSALSDHTLRDIGLHHSEIESFAAELAGKAEPSRVQTVRDTPPATVNEPAGATNHRDTGWRQAA